MPITEFGINVVKALTPSGSSDPETQLHWRWAVALALFAVIIVGGVSFAWAQGLIPGISGVATEHDIRVVADQVDGLKKQVDLGKTLNLEQAILTERTGECQAENATPPNQLAASFALQTLQR